MKYDKWHSLRDLFNIEDIIFKGHIVIIPNAIATNGLKKFKAKYDQIRDDFFEECRENYVNEDWNEVMLWYQDCQYKLDLILNELFIKDDTNPNILTFKPNSQKIKINEADIKSKAIYHIYNTIIWTQQYLTRRINNGEITLNRGQKNEISNHHKFDRKKQYGSNYKSNVYSLHPNILKNNGIIVSLQDAYNKLKEQELIADDYLLEFLHLFDEQLEKGKDNILWIGEVNYLKYFILQLREKEIIVDPKRKLFAIAESNFSFIKLKGKDNQENCKFTPATLSGRKNPANIEMIDEVIEIIRGIQSA